LCAAAVPGRRCSRIGRPDYEGIQGAPSQNCRSRNHHCSPVTLLTRGALLEVTPGGVMAPILRGEGSQAPTCWGRPGSPRAGPAPALPAWRVVWRWAPQRCDGLSLLSAVGVGPGPRGLVAPARPQFRAGGRAMRGRQVNPPSSACPMRIPPRRFPVREGVCVGRATGTRRPQPATSGLGGTTKQRDDRGGCAGSAGGPL
jgi:hypothetical protein